MLFGKYQDFALQYFHNTAVDVKTLCLLTGVLNFDGAFFQGRNQRRVVLENLEQTINARKLYQTYFATIDGAVGGSDF